MCYNMTALLNTPARPHSNVPRIPLSQVLNAVSWAKFGEQSTLDFKWNCIKEKIAVAEGIEPRAVVEFLRHEAEVILMEK